MNGMTMTERRTRPPERLPPCMGPHLEDIQSLIKQGLDALNSANLLLMQTRDAYRDGQRLVAAKIIHLVPPATTCTLPAPSSAVS